MAARLLAAVDAASGIDELEAAFPIPMWETRASLAGVADAMSVA